MAMTVKQLKDVLKDLPDDLEIFLNMSDDHGGYLHDVKVVEDEYMVDLVNNDFKCEKCSDTGIQVVEANHTDGEPFEVDCSCDSQNS